MSIYALLNYLGFNTEIILIDYNGMILAKKNWEKTLLKNNDMLEIITIAGGG
jgi:thiamine biosynthesis protein ThiS